MGVQAVLGVSPSKLALETINSAEDKHRRREMKRRVDFYLDNGAPHLKTRIKDMFLDPKVRQRLMPFAELAMSYNIYRRVVDEIARPVYATPPVRRLASETENKKYQVLATESRLNDKMDLSARLVQATNKVWQFYRMSDRLGLVIDVLTPDMATPIPDPDDPTREIALIYDKRIGPDLWHVYWDDEVTFTFNSDGRMKGPAQQHGLGMIPRITIDRRQLWGVTHDTKSGNDLVELQMSVALVIALSLKLHKSQGFRQIVISGDTINIAKGQTLDEETALVTPDGTTISTLDLKSDAKHYTETATFLVEGGVSNYGISRERLNQKTVTNSDDIPLLERRAEVIGTFRRAEHDAFEVIKRVSKEHSNVDLRMSDNARLKTLDFAEISDRTDKKTLLEIWEKKQRMGLRNVIDNIKALNPEIGTDKEAEEELQRNIDITSKWVKEMRALNQAKDVDADKPGQSPEDNGRMGPAVRDGEMSRDDAAQRAQGQPGQAEELADGR